MRKLYKYILFDVLIFSIVYFALFFTLKQFNLIFMPWIRKLAIAVIPLGIILGFIQLNLKINKKRIIKRIFSWIGLIILTIIISFVMLLYLVLFYNYETITYYEGVKMIEETRSVWKMNYIKYYDYTNPFVRSRQERVRVSYDDAITESEYAGTTFYNKEGKEVENFEGVEYVDLSQLKKYDSKNASYEDVVNLLEEVKEDYANNMCEVRDSGNILIVRFTNVPENKAEQDKCNEFKSMIDNFIKNETKKEDSVYSINVHNTGLIGIMNDTYYTIKY